MKMKILMRKLDRKLAEVTEILKRKKVAEQAIPNVCRDTTQGEKEDKKLIIKSQKMNMMSKQKQKKSIFSNKKKKAILITITIKNRSKRS